LYGRKRQVEHVSLSSSSHLSDPQQPLRSETLQLHHPNSILPRRRPSFEPMDPPNLCRRNKMLHQQPLLLPSVELQMLLQTAPTFLANPSLLFLNHHNSHHRLHHLSPVYAISISNSLSKTSTSVLVALSVPNGSNKNSGTSSKMR
jgi:hypothetical protein